MTAQVQRAPVRAQHGPLFGIVAMVFALLLTVFGSLLFGTIIEWVGMHVSWMWKEEGIEHSRRMVDEDIGYLAEYKRSLVVDDTQAFAQSWANAATKMASSIGLIHLIELGQKPVPPTENKFKRQARDMVRGAGVYLLAAIFVWQDAFVRLAIVVLALPAFILAMALGLVDGLARRDIRKWSGGRESSFVYHHAKRMMWPSITGGFFLYLSWPTGGFNPAWIILPFGAATAWTASLIAASFKKYL